MQDKPLADVFSDIYSKDVWKVGVSGSGPGSNPEATKEYRETIRKFLAEKDIRTVVDYGCGDWAFSRLIDWSGRDYLGLDPVEAVVARNQEEFGAPNVRFGVGDLTGDDGHSADLLICKDVLQHLPNAVTSKFLAGKLRRFRWAILTNDYRMTVPTGWRNLWRAVDAAGRANADTDAGGHHTLLLRQPPFNLEAKVLLRYDVVVGATTFKKEVLLWENPGPVGKS